MHLKCVVYQLPFLVGKYFVEKNIRMHLNIISHNKMEVQIRFILLLSQLSIIFNFYLKPQYNGILGRVGLGRKEPEVDMRAKAFADG